MTCLLDVERILLGEVTCYSLVGVKGLNDWLCLDNTKRCNSGGSVVYRLARIHKLLG